MSTITALDSLKMIRETFCVAQTHVGLSGDPRKREHVDRMQRLIDDIDRQRPLGPDGKHGDLHTADCGCGPATQGARPSQAELREQYRREANIECGGCTCCTMQQCGEGRCTSCPCTGGGE